MANFDRHAENFCVLHHIQPRWLGCFLAIPSAFVRTPWSGWGLPGQGGAHHCLNDLDRAGPTCSASPGRRCWDGVTIPECPRTRRRHCLCLDHITAPDLPSTMAARGFFVCRAAGGLATACRRPKARGNAAGRQARPRFGGARGLRSGPP